MAKKGTAARRGGVEKRPSGGARSGGRPAPSRARQTRSQQGASVQVARAERADAPSGKAAVSSDAPSCPVDKKCGGCKNLRVPYAEQLERKRQAIAELYEGLADAEAFCDVLGMEEPYHYRNKVVSPYAFGRPMANARAKTPGRVQGKGGHVAGKAGARREILTGMYAVGTHKLVPTDTCLIENEAAKAVTLAVRDLMARWGIEPYDEDTGRGFLRHAVVRVGHTSGEVLVTLVTNAKEFPSSKSFCRELVRRCPQITTVVQNVNERQTNVILGSEEHTLYGPGFILDELCGLSFRISSQSFYQVNAVQTEVLYRRAMELARLDGTQTAIDAYCGTGTIGLVAATCGAARVVGVDSVAQAVADARQNARHNGVENAEFVAGDAGDFMRELARSQREARAGGRYEPFDASKTVLFMDPPRAGSSEEFLAAVAELVPARIVYISCNPKTQVRDVRRLMQSGWRVAVVQPVDMFPHTDHIECIAVLERA